MRATLLFFLIPFISFGQFIDLYSIPESEVDLNPIIQPNKELPTRKIESFQASDFVTVEQYGTYLKCIKYDSTLAFYNSQLPNFDKLEGIDPSDYFENPAYRNEPVMGVTWMQAVNFCRWMNSIHNVQVHQEYYKIPDLGEWLAIYQFKINRGIRVPFSINKEMSDWLMDAYDESIYEFMDWKEEESHSYHYAANDEDPPSMKRKRYIGDNFKYAVNDLSQHYRLYEYQDTSRAHIGFRVVKVKPKQTDSNYPLNAYFLQNYSVEAYVPSYTVDSTSNEIYRYEHDEGILDGHFVHLNKDNWTTEGYFKNNQRSGLWTVTDDKGNLVIARIYCDNLRYISILPDHRTNNSSYRIETAHFKKKFGPEGFRFFDYVREADVQYSKRLWRILDKGSNPLIFDSVNVCQVLINAALEEKLTVYGADSDQFKTVLSTDDVQKIQDEAHQIDGYELKEDFFFDRYRLLGDTRIIGFAPYYENEEGERINICWFYYPACRATLFQHKLMNIGNHKIRNADDIFFWRYFKSVIIKESTVYDMHEQIVTPFLDLKLIGMEHDLWISYNR